MGPEKKQTIMIVDDSEMNRAILTEMLAEEYGILEAEDGLEAIEILSHSWHEVSLVLLDLMMPKMDGFAVLEYMKKMQWLEEFPVLIISAESDSSQVQRAYEIGATDFIIRPFNALIVHKRVNNTILLYEKQKRLMGMLAAQIYEKEKRSSMLINILSHIVEFRNGESGPHVIHVRVLTELLLDALCKRDSRYQFTAAEISMIGMASSLHDIGKISIAEGILNKPGRLTKEEREIMQTHSMIGAEILEELPVYQKEPLVKIACQICRWHHERYDGNGYPDGLKGDDIPIYAQIVSIADVYDALTSERVYKKAFSHEKAIEMILNGECGSFNPLVLKCLNDIEKEIPQRLNSEVERHDRRELKDIVLESLENMNLSVSEQYLALPE